MAFEKKLSQVSIKSRNKFITADLIDYRGALLKLQHSVRDFYATDSAGIPRGSSGGGGSACAIWVLGGLVEPLEGAPQVLRLALALASVDAPRR